MNKVLLEVNFNNKLNENDIVVFQNGKWIAVNKEIFLNDVYKKCKNLNSKLDDEITDRNLANNQIHHEIEEINATLEVFREQINFILGEDDND